MNYLKYSLALFLLIAGTATSIAQQTISLQDALTYALKNSKAVTKARLDIKAGDYKIKEVRAAALPQIDVTSQLTRNIKAQKFILPAEFMGGDRKSTRLNSSHVKISYAVFCLKKKKKER